MMNVEFYLALTSLIGVLLGGCMSYAIQRTTQRAADRAEAQRQRIAHAEARYAERVAIIDRFLAAVQDAERAAFDHHTPARQGRNGIATPMLQWTASTS